MAAIGSPGTNTGAQLENTITGGTISSSERKDIWGADYIQVDVAINPGNSGGPIFSQYAEVIGMSTWQYVGKQKLNFAVRIADIREAVLAHPYGSFDAPKEETAIRALLETYWKAVMEKDLDTLGRLLPTYLYEKEQSRFNSMMEAFRREWEIHQILERKTLEQILAQIEKEEGPGRALLLKTILSKKEGEEFTPDEIRDYYARSQLVEFERANFKDYRINSITLDGGTAGKFNVTMTVREETGRERPMSAIRHCVKVREEWKIYSSPPAAGSEEDEDRPR